MIYYRQGELHEGGVLQDVASPSFRFGVGFYETLLYNGSVLCNVPAHLERARQSLEYFGFVAEEVEYEEAVAEVLHANRLAGAPARVNIFYPVDDEAGSVVPIVTAVPYVRQPEKVYRLSLSSVPVQHPYYVHKSMNYMFHWMERRNAQLLGFDDAVLIQQGNVLLETTTAALLFSDGTNFCVPNSMDKLESTALAAARGLLSIHGCTVRAHTASSFKHAYVLNSLIGMRPVGSLNGVTYAVDAETCRQVSEIICA